MHALSAYWLLCLFHLLVAEKVYKYFHKTWPPHWKCTDNQLIAQLIKSKYACIIGGKMETVEVIDPTHLRIKRFPMKRNYSRFDEEIKFSMELKGKNEHWRWMKIKPVDKSFNQHEPQIDNNYISWDNVTSGVFRFFIVTPFNSIGFTLFITKEVTHEPLQDTFFTSRGSHVGFKFITPNHDYLNVRGCKFTDSAFTASVVNNMVKIDGTYSGLSTIQCIVELPDKTLIYYTTTLNVIVGPSRMNQYFPALQKWRIRTANAKPSGEIRKTFQPRNCIINGDSLLSLKTAFNAGNDEIVIIRCNNVVIQTCYILDRKQFLLTWTSKTNPYSLKLSSGQIALNDFEMLRCWQITLDNFQELPANQLNHFESTFENFAIRCIAFAGYSSVTTQAYLPQRNTNLISVMLKYSVHYYLIGERMDDAEVIGYDTSVRLPSTAITCAGDLPFNSPFINLQERKQEGDVNMTCFASNNGLTSQPIAFIFAFFFMHKFRLESFELKQFVYLIPSYNNTPEWKYIKPSSIIHNVCSVTCYWHASKKYTNTIKRNDFSREFHVFNCFCIRTLVNRKRGRQANVYSFVIKEGLLIFKDPSRNCTAKFHPEVVLGLRNRIKSQPLVEYTINAGSDCPPFECFFKNTKEVVGNIINWNKKTRKATIDGFLPLMTSQADAFCNTSLITIYDYSKTTTLKYKPSHGVIIPELVPFVEVYYEINNMTTIPAKRCLFPEIQNAMRNRGLIAIKSFYKTSFNMRMLCWDTLEDEGVDLGHEFLLMPLRDIKANITPVYNQVEKIPHDQFHCNILSDALKNAYGPPTMEIFIDNVLLKSTATGYIKIDFNETGPHYMIIKCLIQNLMITSMVIVAYGSFPPGVFFLPKGRDYFLINAVSTVNSRVQIEPDFLRENSNFTSVQVGSKVKIYKNGELHSSSEIPMPIIDATTIQLKVSPSQKIFIIDNEETVFVVECRIDGVPDSVTNDQSDYLRTQWEFNTVDNFKSPIIINQSSLIINHNVNTGIFCLRCRIPGLQHISPIITDCFTVLHRSIFNFRLKPKSYDMMLLLEQVVNASCVSSLIPPLKREHLFPKLNCEIRSPSHDARIYDGVLHIAPGTKHSKMDIEIVFVVQGVDISIGLHTLYLAEYKDIALQFPDIKPLYDAKQTASITCSFGWSEINKAFVDLLKWILVNEEETVVPYQKKGVITFENGHGITNNYACKLFHSKWVLVKHLQITVLDVDNVIFYANTERRIYLNSNKNFTVECLVKPTKMMGYPGFHHSWVDLKKSKAYERLLGIDEYEEGAHDIKCGSKLSKSPFLIWTFYIISSTATLKSAQTLEREYRKFSEMPDCIWSVAWMNQHPYLKPETRRTGRREGRNYIGNQTCIFYKDGFSVTKNFPFKILNIFDVSLQRKPPVDSVHWYVQLPPHYIECLLVPKSVFVMLKPTIFWMLDDVKLSSKVYMREIGIGYHNLSCHVSSIMGLSSNLDLFVLEKTPKLTVGNVHKKTYLPSEKKPKCLWEEQWLNEIFINTSTLFPQIISVEKESVIENVREVLIECSYPKIASVKTFKYTYFISQNKYFRLSISHPYVATNGSYFETIICNLYPPTGHYPTWHVVKNHKNVKVVKDTLVWIESEPKDIEQFGTYICSANQTNLDLTRIFTIGFIDREPKPVFEPLQREYVSGTRIFCKSKSNNDAGQQIIKVIVTETKQPHMKQENRMLELISDTIKLVTISCSVHVSYLTTILPGMMVQFSTMIRPEEPVLINPIDATEARIDTVIHCRFMDQSGATETHALKLFLSPNLYAGDREKSMFTFRDSNVPGGKYLFVCILSDETQKIWAKIKTITYNDIPTLPYLAKAQIYQNDRIQCMSKAFPITSRMIYENMSDENGKLVQAGNFQEFHRESLYGPYTINCTAGGVYNDVSFLFATLHDANYTGAEYVLQLIKPNELSYNYDRIGYAFCQFFVVLLMIVGLKMWSSIAYKSRMKEIELLNETSNEWKPEPLKNMRGQFSYIKLGDFNFEEAQRLMVLMSVFDECFNALLPKLKWKRKSQSSSRKTTITMNFKKRMTFRQSLKPKNLKDNIQAFNVYNFMRKMSGDERYSRKVEAYDMDIVSFDNEMKSIEPNRV